MKFLLVKKKNLPVPVLSLASLAQPLHRQEEIVMDSLKNVELYNLLNLASAWLNASIGRREGNLL